MGDTKIRWTGKTWNPVSGCSHVSPGCEHCYAEALSLRFGRSQKPWKAQFARENVRLHPERLTAPLKWRVGTRVFVNSVSDLFHELVPFEFIDQVFDVMERCPQHTFQILTKRPALMRQYARRREGQGLPILANVWLGTSVEDERRARERIPVLQSTPAACRFLSCEPLLGPLGSLNLDGISWVIAGGESGPGYRPMDHAWAREIRDQCISHDPPVSFYFKQSAAPRTEMGIELQEEDGTRTLWEQFPDDMGLLSAIA